MKSKKLVTELNSCLETVAQERDEYQDGLSHLAKQIKKAKKDLLKMLKKESDKTKRKLLKRDLRKVEMACQGVC